MCVCVWVWVWVYSTSTCMHVCIRYTCMYVFGRDVYLCMFYAYIRTYVCILVNNVYIPREG